MVPIDSSPRAAAFSAEVRRAATLPSLIGDELPAVTDPFSENADFKPPKISNELSARIDSSRVKPANGATQSSCIPRSHAAAAR